MINQINNFFHNSFFCQQQFSCEFVSVLLDIACSYSDLLFGNTNVKIELKKLFFRICHLLADFSLISVTTL